MPLTDREQRLAFLGAAVAAVASVALWVGRFDETPAIVLAAIGVAMAALLWMAARMRNRLLTGGAAFILMLGPWGWFWILGALYALLAVAIWFPLRRRPPRKAAADPDPGAAAPAAPSAKERKPPSRNKRYTPPGSRTR